MAGYLFFSYTRTATRAVQHVREGGRRCTEAEPVFRPLVKCASCGVLPPTKAFIFFPYFFSTPLLPSLLHSSHTPHPHPHPTPAASQTASPSPLPAKSNNLAKSTTKTRIATPPLSPQPGRTTPEPRQRANVYDPRQRPPPRPWFPLFLPACATNTAAQLHKHISTSRQQPTLLATPCCSQFSGRAGGGPTTSLYSLFSP